ncbi:spermatogenesis-associated protein 3 [Ctenodactylus gundi]
MKKGKKKKSETRRHRESISQRVSSDSSTPQTSSETAQQSSDSTPQQPLSQPSPQWQPSPESTSQQPAAQALPAPQTHHASGSVVPPKTTSKGTSSSRKAGPVTHVALQICSCAACPGTSACWHRLGLCHSRIFDVLLPRDWQAWPRRELPNLLTFYRFLDPRGAGTRGT